MSSKFIDGAAREAAATFQLPSMDGSAGAAAATNSWRMPTAQEIEDLRQAAHQEGFELGHEEGLAAGRAVVQARLDALTAVLDRMAEPFRALDDRVVEEAAQLAMLVARHVIRRELRMDPGEIVAVVRETMQQLPVAARQPVIHLHPEDVERVSSAMSLSDAHNQDPRGWRLEADPRIARGGCIVETATSRIDGTVEQRLNAIAAMMLGGERQGDHEAEDLDGGADTSADRAASGRRDDD